MLRLDTTTAHPVQLPSAPKGLSEARKRADLLRIVPRHRRAALKKDAETLLLGGLGKRRINQLGLMSSAIVKKFILYCVG
jgi:hypothetical protein